MRSLPLEKRLTLEEMLKTSRVFKLTYRNDPAAFIYDCISWPDGTGPAIYQEETLAELPRRKRVAERGPHGLGKTTTAALALIWFAATRDGEDWKAPTTASAWRQLEKYLWPEVHKWVRRIKWNRLGCDPWTERQLLTLALKLRTGEAFAVASDNSDLIEGAHADHLFYIFDEAKAIPEKTWDAAEGAFSTPGEIFVLAISTPGPPVGRFYDIHKRKPGYEDWWVRHVTLEEAIKAGRIDPAWAEQRRKQWGEKSAVFQNRVLGEFAASEEDGVIPLSWVEAAIDRWLELRDAKKLPKYKIDRVGVDVARGGSDKSTLALKAKWVVTELRTLDVSDTMIVTGEARALLRRHKSARAVVDVIGLGAGVFDRLREQGMPVEPFNAGEKTDRLDKSGEFGFVDTRSAAWWNMRELLDPDSGEPVALPPDDELIGDLTAPRWWATSGGKIKVESKDELRKPSRLGRSTDKADAVVMAFWEDSNFGVAF